VLPWIVAASGPCEEGTRLVVLLLVGRTFPIALSVGLGWTAIEVVYTIVNGLAVASLLGRTDEKARQAQALLTSLYTTRGLTNMLTPSAPFLGVMERISASALHIGFTLLLAWQPLLVLATIPLHSATNFIALRLLRRSAVLTEVVVALIGATALVAGLAAFGRL
jgi:YhfC intramembrane metalloprotease